MPLSKINANAFAANTSPNVNTLLAGASTSVAGDVYLQGKYGSGVIANFGAHQSSGGPAMSYGVRVSQNTSVGGVAYISTTPIAISRSVLEVQGNYLRYRTTRANNYSTAVDSEVPLSGFFDDFVYNYAYGLSIPNQVGFNQAWGANAYYSVSSGTIIKFGLTGGSGAVNSQTGQFNTGGYYNTSTGLFTAPVAGRYLFNFQAYHQLSSGMTDAYVTGQINGTNVLYSAGSGNAGYQGLTISAIFNLAQNDTFGILSGPALNIYGMARLSGYYLG